MFIASQNYNAMQKNDPPYLALTWMKAYIKSPHHTLHSTNASTT
jgi:hypothetical protein